VRPSRNAARLSFRGAPAHVRVPATSANLGPGFDVLGLALALYDDVIARIGEDGVRVDVAGEGAGDVPIGEDHLIIQAMRTTFALMGSQPRGIELVCANRIPHGRGLGSSSAAICAGILLARALVLGGDDLLPDSELVALASRIEGHPDNVAACLLGGLAIAWTASKEQAPPLEGSQSEHRAYAVTLQPSAQIRAVALVPESSASTKAARALLPVEVSFGDAVFNIGRSSLCVAAITHRPDALLIATDDRLHQPYRASTMPATADLVGRLRAAGIPAMVSGAGPTVLVLTAQDQQVRDAVEAAPSGWVATELGLDARGAHIVID
jgi:homoserine kinase